MKGKVYWEDAPEDHDPLDSGWYSKLTYPDGMTITQGHHTWREAFNWAFLNIALEAINP